MRGASADGGIEVSGRVCSSLRQEGWGARTYLFGAVAGYVWMCMSLYDGSDDGCACVTEGRDREGVEIEIG